MAGLDHKTIADRDIDIRTALHEGDAIIRDAHVAGADGSQVVQRRTALVDRVLRELHGRLTTSGPMPGLIATGGYGRGELNPQSDIDIMFLCRDQADRQRAPEMLYQLWDGGTGRGLQRTHGPGMRRACAAGHQDTHVAHRIQAHRMRRSSLRLLPESNAQRCILLEGLFVHYRKGRRAQCRAPAVRRLRLPAGAEYQRRPRGLRDIHTAFWVAFTHFRVPSLADLIPRGILTEGRYAVFLRSRNFLWKLRNELHYLSGRRNDHLTYEMQERTAKISATGIPPICSPSNGS